MPSVLRHKLVRAYEGELGEDGVFEFTEEYAVKTDAPLDSDLLIRFHPKTPKNQKPHGTITLARVLDVRIRTKDQLNWRVLVDYSTEVGEEEARNPLARPAVTSMTSGRKRDLTQEDGRGRPLLNTAFDLYAPQEIERPIKRFRVTKNIPVEYPDWLEDLDWATNDGDVLFASRTRKRHTLLVDGMSIGEPDDEKDPRSGRTFEFRPLELEIAWDPRGWTRTLWNEGFNELAEITLFDDAGNVDRTVREKQRILLDDGEPPAKKLLLNGKGRPFRDESGRLTEPEGAVDPDGARIIDNGQQLDDEVRDDEESVMAIRWLPMTEAPFSVLPLE